MQTKTQTKLMLLLAIIVNAGVACWNFTLGGWNMAWIPLHAYVCWRCYQQLRIWERM